MIALDRDDILDLVQKLGLKDKDWLEYTRIPEKLYREWIVDDTGHIKKWDYLRMYMSVMLDRYISTKISDRPNYKRLYHQCNQVFINALSNNMSGDDKSERFFR